MRSRRLFWNVVDQLEAMIDSGAFVVGSRLPPERELAEMYKVSRPTIREAIIALEERGRVEVKTNSGIYVLKNTTPEPTGYGISALELIQARALVEGETAALAATTITREELDQLNQVLADLKLHGAGKYQDKKFHLIIAQATRNKAVVIMMERLWHLHSINEDTITALNDAWFHDASSSIEEYVQIFNALKNGDARAARSAIHQHLQRLLDILLALNESSALEDIKRKTNETRELYSFEYLSGQ